ncbi:MAG TPA: hypothetical protein VL574_17705 [Stellaceae bacterium]|jgi:hypothetical protein|nr:hypothetical protein [Stellaceae bacterium]
MALEGRYGFATTWRSKATLLAILAVLQQALLLAWIVPAGAMPPATIYLSGGPGFGAAICGQHHAGPTSQSHDGPAAPCQLCPFCIALANPASAPPPSALAGPIRFFVALPRLVPRPDRGSAMLIGEAPRQRGPPAAPTKPDP